MKDLLTVVKEATAQVREKYLITGERLAEKQLEEVVDIIAGVYRKQSFWWRLINTSESYVQLVMLDLRYNFIGGGILKEGEDTVIEIK